MESYVVNEKERELDIKQLLFYILDNIKWAILVGLLCGILLGAYGYVKASKSDTPEAASASIQDIIRKNRTKWNSLDATVTADAFNDPLPGTYLTNAKVYVDFDYSNIEENTNLDFTAMNNKLQGDIVALAGCNSSRQAAIDDINLHSYIDMKSLSMDDLRYMSSFWFSGANILQIQVADTDGDRAVAITNSLVDNLIKTASQYETVDNIRVIEDASIIYFSEYESKGSMSYVKNAILYGAVGVFLGFVLVAVICFLTYVFKDTVRTKEDIDSMEFNAYWIIHSAKDKRDIEIKRLAYSLGFLDKKQIAIVPIDRYSVSSEFKEGLLSKDINNNVKINVSENILDNPEVVLEAKKSDAVILASAYGKTRINDIKLVQKELMNIGIEIAGIIVTETRH